MPTKLLKRLGILFLGSPQCRNAVVRIRYVLRAFIGGHGIRQQSRQSIPCKVRSLRRGYGIADNHGRDTNNKSANK
ncbi:hypothetical protein [Nostoc sp. FACHB-133]|uniref:hypothetical protein n=1 Tax=Nostoc sp. FACHB-133 TaxID=2692835 RepID=UPI001689309F|nr:hypothetical protein [Nostoc sp. FACHB-133]MBD2527518.1 hypothetical protein [Nostoc sp. FACHB-133]